MVVRWIVQLSQFDIDMQFKAGRKHLDADCLSRRPHDLPTKKKKPEEEKEQLDMMQSQEYNQNNHPNFKLQHTKEDQSSLSNEQEVATADSNEFTHHIASISAETIGRHQQTDPSLSRVRRKFAKKDGSYCKIDGVLWKTNFTPTGEEKLLVIPKRYRKEILEGEHASLEAGHLGLAKTYSRLARRFFWPGFYRDTSKFVRTCKECQERKASTEKLGLLHPLKIPRSPFEVIGIDLVIVNRSDQGNKVFITAIDFFSKYLVAAVLEDASALQTAKFLLEKV